MPVFLLTFHGYATWMPDHQRGYTRKGEGVFVTDGNMSKFYRRNQRQPAVHFDEKHQRAMIEEAINAAGHQDSRLHAAGTDLTHLHMVLSWTNARTPKQLQRSQKSSLTRRLNSDFERRTWFSRDGVPERVEDHSHLQHLILNYLPGHDGLQWNETRGFFIGQRK